MTEKIKSEKKETNTHQEKQIIADERTQSTSDQSINDKQNVFWNNYQRLPYQEIRADYGTVAI